MFFINRINKKEKMKKVLSIVFLVAAMLFAANANAQIKFGLKGGQHDIHERHFCCLQQDRFLYWSYGEGFFAFGI